MDIPEYPAITALCGIMARLPDETRRTALGFLCTALGQPPDPTGIEVSPDREIRHLYWNHETKDLYNRLVDLVEEVGLKEQLAVQGAAIYITTHFAQLADPVFSQSCTAGFRHTIENMESELHLPLDRRDGRQSDAQIRDFIQKLHDLIESAESRRQDAEKTRDQLASDFGAAFSLQFWDALDHLGVEQARPHINDLLSRPENGNDLSEDE